MDALNDKSVAELLFHSKYYQPALFHIEQLCEKSTKACLAMIGTLLTKEHLFANNVKEDIMPISGELEADFKKYLPLLRKLQLLYVRTRYASMSREGSALMSIMRRSFKIFIPNRWITWSFVLNSSSENMANRCRETRMD